MLVFLISKLAAGDEVQKCCIGRPGSLRICELTVCVDGKQKDVRLQGGEVFSYNGCHWKRTFVSASSLGARICEQLL